jgi:hypothetical protein
MARAVGISAASVQRLWAANDIKPHLSRTFKLSNDKQFEEKFWDVTGLYRDPPRQGAGVVLRREITMPDAGAHAAVLPLASDTFAPRPTITCSMAH